jgi:HlyD family secretion protein
MRRVAPVLVALLVLAALVTRERWMPLLAPWFAAGPAPGTYLGYVEGETTLVAAPAAGRIVERPVSRGQPVKTGALLFRLDPAAAEAEVARAEAALAEAKAALADLGTGMRESELEVIRAQRREAEAQLRLAEQDLVRAAELAQSGSASQARLDQARSQVDQLRAHIQMLDAEEKTGTLGGRAETIAAAQARVREAEASLASANVRLCDLAPVAPEDASVDDTFFDAGEWVQAGQPVVALLAPGRVKLRFFVPEADIALARPGATISYRCDGCAPGLKAAISFVAPRAEFTPPVIYSESARAKLVFMVEARPVTQDGALRPGLPVEVAPLAPVPQ